MGVISGCIILARGIRGTLELSEPRCAKCKYDLRASLSAQMDKPKACPECGADLTPRKAVYFGRSRSRPRLMIVGVGLILLALILPVLIGFGLFRLGFNSGGRGPAGSRSLSNSALIVHLASTIDQPWDWQELERRLKAGQLTFQQVDQTFDVLTAHLNQQRAAGKPVNHLPWSGSYLKQAITSNSVSPAKITALHQAYYDSSSPTIRVPTTVRVGQPIKSRLDVKHINNLDNTQRVWVLNAITADGVQPLTPRLQRNEKTISNPDKFSGQDYYHEGDIWVDHSLPPGEHELAFTFDVGTVPYNVVFRGLDGKPGTANKWPNPYAQWQTVVKKKIKIVGKNDPVITLITDPAQNPLANNPLKVAEAIVRPASQDTQLVIKWDEFTPSLPVSYQVTVVVGQKRFPYGSYMRTSTGSSISSQLTISQLPPEIRKMDLILTPEPRYAEWNVDVDQIWGLPYEITDVPLQRFDLPPAP